MSRNLSHSIISVDIILESIGRILYTMEWK